MNTYILVISMAIYAAYPHSLQISEFQSKESCEVALNEAKKFWKTIDRESKCISVSKEIAKKKIIEQLEKSKKAMGEE